MIEHKLPLGESELRARYQDMLPAGLVLESRLVSNLRFGDLFLAKDARFGASGAVLRSIRFVPPQGPVQDGDAWNDWPAWREAFLERMAAFAGLQLPHFAAPIEVANHASGRAYVVSPYHRRSVAELIDSDQNPICPHRSRLIAEETLAALAGLHARGLPHADVRPENIFVEQSSNGDGLAVTWLGDPAVAALQVCSRNRLHDPQRARYYPAQAAGESLAKADLYALARLVCDLALPDADELMETGNEAPSAKTLWAACSRPLRLEPQTGDRTARLKSFVGGAAGVSRRRLRAIVAALLGEPSVETLWQRVLSRLHPIVAEQPEDAAKAMVRLRRQDLLREASERRLLTAGSLAMLAIVIVLLAELVGVRRLESDLAISANLVAKGQGDVIQANAEIADRDSRIEDLKRQLHEKDFSERTLEIRRIRDDLHKIAAGMPGTGPPKPAPMSARSRAQEAWRGAFPKITPGRSQADDKRKLQQLFEEWNRKDSAAASFIKTWKEGTNRDGGIEELWRQSKPWLIADADLNLKNLSEQARVEPWEKLSEAERRMEDLRTAAERWEKCASSGVDLKELIDNQPNEDVKKILKAWYEKLLRTTNWTLQLDEGKTLLGAGLPPSRVVSIDAGSEIVGTLHNWDVGKTTSPGCESSFDYGSKQNSGLRNISFDWRCGEGHQGIHLYVEQDWPWYTPLVKPDLIAQTFDGPLAIWKLDQAERVTSSDKQTTLSYRVIDCPGPPRRWNVTRTVAKKAIEASKQILQRKRVP